MTPQNPVLVLASNRHGIDWQRSTSRHGHLLAEVLSAAIKELRRGHEEQSLYWALEMATACRQAEEFLWECLLVFTSEDVGLANPEALRIVSDLKEAYFQIPPKDRRRFVFLAHATCHLARSKKSRYVTEILCDTIDRIEDGTLTYPMPDYAVDIHTARGKSLGRGELHYLTTAALLTNDDRSYSDKYLQRLIDRASRE